MKKFKINVSQLLTQKNLNVRSQVMVELTNHLVKGKYNGITFNVMKYNAGESSLQYNNKFLVVGSKKIPIRSTRDYDYLSMLSDNIIIKNNRNFFFCNYLSRVLFRARIIKSKKIIYELVKEVEQSFPESTMSNEVRVYYLKENFFFANKNFIRLEIAHFIYSDLKAINLEFRRKINEYYSLTSQFVSPVKHLSQFISLPNKILDNNFKTLSSQKHDNYCSMELFLKKNIKSQEDLSKLHSDLKYFYNEIVNSSIEAKVIYLRNIYTNKRSQFRLIIKKHFLNRNKLLGEFLDSVIYLKSDYSDFTSITKELIDHLEKYYIIA